MTDVAIADRIASQYEIDEASGCWNWTGFRDALGYGMLHWQGRTHTAYRLAYIGVVGPVPEHLEMDHLCRNPSCVNPDHLEPVTHAENVRRGASPWGINWRKTVCKRGHELTPRKRGGRHCTVCDAMHRRNYNARQRAAKAQPESLSWRFPYDAAVAHQLFEAGASDRRVGILFGMSPSAAARRRVQMGLPGRRTGRITVEERNAIEAVVVRLLGGAS